MLPIPNTKLDGKLEQATCGGSVPGSGGTCSHVTEGRAAGTSEQAALLACRARQRQAMSAAIWLGVLQL